MKLRILPFLFFLFTVALLTKTHAQTLNYNDEWIDYSKTFYKFKVGADGLYRITGSQLQSIGLGATPSEQFQLYKNGVQIPLFQSVTGMLGATDYIEFYGTMNDGSLDTKLFRDPTKHLNNKYSLQTDTAAYFLTVETNTALNKRISSTPNLVASNILPAETHFINEVDVYFRNRLIQGFAANVGELIYSSSYDVGEGWGSLPVRPASPLNDVTTPLHVYTGSSENAKLSYSAAGESIGNRQISVSVNSNVISDPSISYYNDIKEVLDVPLSMLTSGATATISFKNLSLTTNNTFNVAAYKLTYPSLFNFNNNISYKFNLPASATNDGTYIEIENFNAGGVLPVLLDLTNNKKYQAVLVGSKYAYKLEASNTPRNCLLINVQSGNIKSIANFKQVQFIDYSVPANQGNYIIVSHKNLMQGTTNMVEEYRGYRSSAAGGSYNAKIYDIDQLEDQFAFGIKKHPLSVKNFLRKANQLNTIKPKYVLLIGKGMDYRDYRANESNPITDLLNFVPTFGSPASDNFLASPNSQNTIPFAPIGRLSVVTPLEIKNYLDKVKEYELVHKSTVHTIANKLWQKNIVQVTGSSEPSLQYILDGYVNQYSQILQDSLWGTKVATFSKSTNSNVEQLSSADLERLFKEGISTLMYFGHSSATTLQYSLDNPQNYTNPGKYPVFLVNGCNSGNFFTFYPDRYQSNETLSEKYVLAPNRGAIAFIASTHFGIVNYLDILTNSYFKATNTFKYNNNLGDVFKESLLGLYAYANNGDFYARIHAEESTLHGDPALKINQQELPDYAIEEQNVTINPSFLSVAEASFKVKIESFNLGKAINDSIKVNVKRIYPNGTSEIVYTHKYKATFYNDTLSFSLNIQPLRDKGLNKLEIKIEADDKIAEMSEANNTITKEFYIYEDELRPIFPYNFSIVNTPTIKLAASTANVLAANKTYKLELDTTALFNSPYKISHNITTSGGVVEYTPTIMPINNKVYYWRVASVPSNPNEGYKWNESSFIYLSTSSEGYNQSHIHQFTKSTFDQMTVDSTTGIWNFDKVDKTLFMSNAIYPSAGYDGLPYTSVLNDNEQIEGNCYYNSLLFSLIDSRNLNLMKNRDTTNPSGIVTGLGGSTPVCGPRIYTFEFELNTLAKRNAVINFMENFIPKDFYVLVRSGTHPSQNVNTYAAQWLADESVNGPGKSIYTLLKNYGFTEIDSYSTPRAFCFLYKKGDPNYPSFQTVSPNLTAKAVLNATLKVFAQNSSYTSPQFGPAKEWKELRYDFGSLEAISTDSTKVDVIGVKENGDETVLASYSPKTIIQDISFINASTYPYAKLKVTHIDKDNNTPAQLKYWRLNYVPVPEGAMAPNIAFNFPDSLEVGEISSFSVPFKNVSTKAFDSIKIKMLLIDKNNVTHVINLPKLKNLQPNDTAMIKYSFNTEDYGGNNSVYVEANPDNDQPEQFHFNNFFYKNLYVKPDLTNPFLDVTFDGVHILSRDIVAAKPNILVKLKDENRFLALADTALLKVKLRYPGSNSFQTIRFDGDTMRFIPANLASGQNAATIEFNPNLPDGEYELMVTGEDKAGNKAGAIEYRIIFRVINKAMVSNLLNYPNPFTTSTAFVFTLTGSKVPDEFKIEILTVSGKIVRTITKDELGQLRIGRNVTDYKWDGTDQYGAPLGNGVYLYRLVTSSEGKALEKFRLNGRENDQNRSDATDKYFKGGYGKMVLIR